MRLAPIHMTSVRIRYGFIGLAVGVLVLGLVTLVGLRIGAAPQQGPDMLRVGAPAPDFSVPLTSGEKVRLAELRGQPVWLTFWATWCPPCRSEMPDLQAVYETSQPGRYQYLAVNFGESLPTVQAYLREIGYTLPVALDTTTEVFRQYRVLGLPTHYFIDERGFLAEVYVGVLSRSQMEQRIAELW